VRDNTLKKLGTLGQSVWLDYIQRDLVANGQLLHLIEADGLRGMTSNPAIFEKAIDGSHEYDADIKTMSLAGMGANEIYEALTQGDVQMAAAVFTQVYESSDGMDGYVSLEINPHLAHDAKGAIAEARRLWGALTRPNVLIKIPATNEGLTVISQLISEGINVNVTLLFGLTRYQQVAEAYIVGLEMRLAKGESLKNVASVASFFLSRIDALIDPLLEGIVAQNGYKSDIARQTLGLAAVASAKLAYQNFKEIFNSERFKKLAEKGARPQRLLWASAENKNPAYGDLKYVEALIGPGTVCTIPIKTMDSFRDDGVPLSYLERDVAQSAIALTQLAGLGISIESVAKQLEIEGVGKFNKSFDKLIKKLAKTSCQ